MNNAILITFWLTIASFFASLSAMMIPPFRELLRGSPLFLTPFAFFFLSAIFLLIFTFRGDVGGTLRTFLLLTGGFGAGVFVSIILHNFIYGLFVHFFGQGIWNGLGGDEPFFFIIGIIVCPLGFLIGAVGSLVKMITSST